MTNVVSLNVPTTSQPQDRGLLKQLKEEEEEEGEAQQEEERGPHLLDTPQDDTSLIMNDDLVFFVPRKDSSNNNDENSNSGSSMNNKAAVMNEKIPNGFLLSHNQKTTHVRGYTTSTPLRRRMHQSNGSGVVPERGWKSTPRRIATTVTKAPSRLPLTIRSPPRFHYNTQINHDPSNHRRSLRLPTHPMILNEPLNAAANFETKTLIEDHVIKSSSVLQETNENHHESHSRRQVVVNKATLIESTTSSRRNGLSKQRVNSCPKLLTTSTKNNKAITKRQRHSFHDDMDLNSKSSDLPALLNDEKIKSDARQKNDLLDKKPFEWDINVKTLPNIDSANECDGIVCEINNHVDKQEANKVDVISNMKKSKNETNDDDTSIVLDMINSSSTARKVVRPDMMSLSLVLCIEPNMEEGQQDRTSPISVDTMEDEEDVLAGVALNTPVSNCETSGVMHLSSTTSTSGSSFNNTGKNRFLMKSRSSPPNEIIDGMIVIKNVDSIIITPPEGNDDVNDDVNEDLLIELFQKMSLSGSNVDNDDDDYDDEINDDESSGSSTSISVSCSGSTSSSSTSICEADDEGTDGDDDDVDEYPLGDTPPSMKLTSSATTYSPCRSGDDDDDHGSSFTSTNSSHFDSDCDVHNQRSPLSMEGVKINLKMFLPGIDNNDECGRCETQDERIDLLVHNDDHHQQLNSTTTALTPTTTPKSFCSEAQGSQFSYAETVVASNVKRSRSPIRLTKSTRTIRKKGLRKTDKVDVGCSCIIL